MYGMNRVSDHTCTLIYVDTKTHAWESTSVLASACNFSKVQNQKRACVPQPFSIETQVLDREECEVRNTGGEMRWFWTPGCASCEGHQTCGAALDINLPRNFLDDWVFDFTDVCPA